jgi:hypothetical protein
MMEPYHFAIFKCKIDRMFSLPIYPEDNGDVGKLLAVFALPCLWDFPLLFRDEMTLPVILVMGKLFPALTAK